MHYFYSADIFQPQVSLGKEEAEHCIKVMRHRNGDLVRLTDGKGNLADALIVSDDHKNCILSVKQIIENQTVAHNGLHLAIAPTKNSDRMEWLVEKAVEIGIEKISFLLCDHSERSRINIERLNRLTVAAMKQSQTTWLPELKIVKFNDFIEESKNEQADKFIAWCDENNTLQLANCNRNFDKMILLIGPEGDFSEAEIQLAKENNYKEVKLGNRRLRTETAGLYGCLVASMHTL